MFFDMNYYKTSEIAKLAGVHPNTVRLYEDINFIPKAERKENGYRVFNDIHLEQIRLARMALRCELLQNGLRKQAIDIIKTSSTGDYENAIIKTQEFLSNLEKEQHNAEEAIDISRDLISNIKNEKSTLNLSRKETAQYLDVTIDTLRNWELNGLVTVERKENGYRIYTDKDIKFLKIIKALRCANYSLMSILRMLKAVSENSTYNIKKIIDTPYESEEIITSCDRLITSISNSKKTALIMLKQLGKMKRKFR